jgi:uncharacterized protein (TIGR04562 family)
MERPNYLSKYVYDWELFNVVLNGHSALDSKYFISTANNEEQVTSFLKGYGLDPNDPVSRAELFGNFQEAMQFVKRYFLKEGNPEGIDVKIPNALYMISDVGDLFLMATRTHPELEERLWAEVILKVMHTILHVDKDLRSNYFPVIQTQIFDRYYKYVYRDEENNLFLGISEQKESDQIPLLDFMTKAKKSRDSVIIKLLHKAENVAEELFDRVGIRFVTKNRFDTLRVVKFLLSNNIVIPHNIKPSRSINTILDLSKIKSRYPRYLKRAIQEQMEEKDFLEMVEKDILEFGVDDPQKVLKNEHSLKAYQSIQFTCRQLIKYKNPFLYEFNQLRKAAKKESEDSTIAKKILSMDTSLIARDIRFFYPYEVQVIDELAHRINTDGEASHQDYKQKQVKSAMNRVLAPLLQLKGIELN